MPAAAKPAANRHARRRAAATGKVSPFAAAFGITAEKPSETDDEKSARRAAAREKGADESDEDYAKRCEQLDKDEQAEDDKEKPEAAEPDDDTGMESEQEKKEAAAFAEGFQAGGQRWADVLSASEAKGKAFMAAHMLGTTDMAAEDIRKALVVMSPDASMNASGLAARMAAERVAPPSPEGTKPVGAVAGAPITAAQVMAAAALARGEAPATR